MRLLRPRQPVAGLGAELQAARERLEADTANLNDAVMAKTAQAKQYKKQTDSIKAKVEKANEVIKREKMTMEQEYKIRLGELNSQHQHSRRYLYQRLKTMHGGIKAGTYCKNAF